MKRARAMSKTKGEQDMCRQKEKEIDRSASSGLKCSSTRCSRLMSTGYGRRLNS